MKLAITADLHGFLPDIEPVDVLIIAGDICPVFNHDEWFQQQWLDGSFRQWLKSLRPKVPHIIGIAGNHDFIFQTRPRTIPELYLPWSYLLDDALEIDGVKFYGSPWIPNLPDWAFHASDIILEDKWADIPDNTEVLITHGPPKNVRDRTDVRYGNIHAGCAYLAERVSKLPHLKLHVFGHIHEARGEMEIASARFINASFVDLDYRIRSEGVVYLEL
jgi:Icc-related predicted phosphoesterase